MSQRIGLGPAPRSTESTFLEKAFVVVSLTILMGAALPLLRKSHAPEPGALTDDGVQQIVFAIIYAVAALLMFRTRTRVRELLRASPEIIALLLWTSVSVTWSAAPEISIRRLVAILGTSMFGYYIVGRFGLIGAMRVLAWSLAVSMLASLLIAIAVPDQGVAAGSSVGWNGVFVHKNMLGRAALLSVLTFGVMAGTTKKGRSVQIALALLSVGLLLLSNSVTSIATTLIFFSFIPLLLALRHSSLGSTALVSVLVGIGGVFAAVILSNPLASLEAVGRAGTFTGRTELWQLSLEHISSEPLLGHGYNGFWLGWEGPSARLWGAINWFPADAHNGYLNILLDLGLVGGVLFSIVAFLALSRVAKLIRERYSAVVLWAAVYLIFFLVYNVTETLILQQNNLTWTLFVGTSAAIALEHKKWKIAESSPVAGQVRRASDVPSSLSTADA